MNMYVFRKNIGDSKWRKERKDLAFENFFVLVCPNIFVRITDSDRMGSRATKQDKMLISPLAAKSVCFGEWGMDS
jgi:hypothetical protein